MKTPWYETAPGATAVLLEGGQFVDCDLYTFSLAGAPLGVSELLYSAGAIDVAIPGMRWPSRQVTFDQGKAKAVGHLKIGLDVDTWQVVAAPRNVDLLSGAASPDRIGTQSWLAAAQAGVFDGATLQVDRAVAPQWPAPGAAMAPTGIITIFSGRIGEIDVGRSQAVITIYSHLKKLADPLPRNLFQAGCIHTLFDQGCTLLAANFAMSGTVAGASESNVLASAVGAPKGSGTYALGRIVMETGASAGFARTVRSWTKPNGSDPGSFTLIKPFPFGVAAGDGFTAYPGCDKQYGTCALFQNQANFGGEIAIPAPETAV